MCTQLLHKKAWWREAASVLRLLLLAHQLGHQPQDVDVIYVSGDNDPTAAARLSPAPVLTNSHEPGEDSPPTHPAALCSTGDEQPAYSPPTLLPSVAQASAPSR